MIYRLLFTSTLCFIVLFSCSQPSKYVQSEWSITADEILDGGVDKDAIPALEEPELVKVPEVGFLKDDDLVIGISFGNESKAYPHSILYWHEIINDELEDVAICINYCPLTGTGMSWNRMIDGELTTFGVSGLLYKSNLLPYDRATESHWTQMGLESCNGERRGKKAETQMVIETTWKTWKTSFPGSTIVTPNTGYKRDYFAYPYQDYRTNHNYMIFKVKPKDDRLPAKERVHGVIRKGVAKVYRFSSFQDGIVLIKDRFMGQEIILAGSTNDNFIVSFHARLEDGTGVKLQAVQDQLPIILEDSQGTQYDMFGYAVFGPNKGQRLKPTTSFMGYWFAWGAFYPGLEIFEP
ncbi:MAG: DUF3179 domain-containing protein [Bacteroidetes bacterium]|nr:DUF3179 domain-containing protein [Bacteroidota bacterium]